MLALSQVEVVESQQLTAQEIIDKSIEYHDPNYSWPTFQGEFEVLMRMPDRPERLSHIDINLPKERFILTSMVDTVSQQYLVTPEKVIYRNNGELVANPDQNRIDRGYFMRDYYTYLYGLPMKLKDQGTMVHEEVEEVTQWGSEYLKIKVTYDPAVGSDVWFFYFDPKNYKLKAYQFYKTIEDGTIDPQSGEYILLSREEIIDDIRIPAYRHWYCNKDTSFLALDMMKAIKP